MIRSYKILILVIIYFISFKGTAQNFPPELIGRWEINGIFLEGKEEKYPFPSIQVSINSDYSGNILLSTREVIPLRIARINDTIRFLLNYKKEDSVYTLISVDSNRLLVTKRIANTLVTLVYLPFNRSEYLKQSFFLQDKIWKMYDVRSPSGKRRYWNPAKDKELFHFYQDSIVLHVEKDGDKTKIEKGYWKYNYLTKMFFIVYDNELKSEFYVSVEEASQKRLILKTDVFAFKTPSRLYKLKRLKRMPDWKSK